MRYFLLSLTLLVAYSAWGTDLYVVRFAGRGKTAQCHQAVWHDDVLLYNSSPNSVNVGLLGISNGSLPPGTPTTITVSAQRPVSLNRQTKDNPWVPIGFNDQYSIWVLHLDIPLGVTVESRDEVSDQDICTPEHIFNGSTGKVSLPVFGSLVAANVPQPKLGTDVGSTPGRQNVAIYNAAATTANATIEVRSVCDSVLLETRNVTVPANTIVQFPSFATGITECVGTPEIPASDRYMLITVDQPSLSIVSTLTEAQPQAPGNIVPLIELAVH